MCYTAIIISIFVIFGKGEINNLNRRRRTMFRKTTDQFETAFLAMVIFGATSHPMCAWICHTIGEHRNAVMDEEEWMFSL